MVCVLQAHRASNTSRITSIFISTIFSSLELALRKRRRFHYVLRPAVYKQNLELHARHKSGLCSVVKVWAHPWVQCPKYASLQNSSKHSCHTQSTFLIPHSVVANLLKKYLKTWCFKFKWVLSCFNGI